MSSQTLELMPLTHEAFASFGNVIEYDGRDFFHINDKMVERYHDLAKVDTQEAGGRTLISWLRARPNTFPSRVRFVERHQLSSQAFIPLDDNPFVVVVAPRGDTVNVGDLRAFITNGRQGVNYHRGVWHHVLLVPKQAMQFIVVDRGGPERNCDEFWFAEEEQPTLEV
ncbi:ureidoglycolate lyase [Paraburkholderia caffeinilytica]|uniref:ureidoglycolate lyase n=1 Tax=Paraburkholderia caffeinilytica TaxID=1761016 RepID=UPI0038B9DF3C